MKVALVSTYTRSTAIGLRYVSACLKAAGHEVSTYFMSSKGRKARPAYSDALLSDFVDRVRPADVIGMSLMTNSYRRASELTQRIRDAGNRAPIVWGGVHPTLAPAECLQHADVVCVGEGERPMLRFVDSLANGEDPTGVASMWFRGGGMFGNPGQVQNPPAQLEQNLDELPFPDYDLETQWVSVGDQLVPAAPSNLGEAITKLTMISSRGCPFHCTFCNNSALREAHAGAGKWVRLRNLDHVLAEMHDVHRRFPMIEEIHIVDDLFFVHDAERIERFVEGYNRDVGLPLLVQISPTTVTDRKVAALAGAPIETLVMGIQSACEDTLRNIYGRNTPLERVAEAMEILARHKMPTEYHYIVNNPYEPDANVIATMRFVASHHRRALRVHTFPLMFFPGTPLFDRARAEGGIDDRLDIAYDHDTAHPGRGVLTDYLTVCLRIVLAMRNVHVPRTVVHGFITLATSRPARWLFQRKSVGYATLGIYYVGRKTYKNFIYQIFIKPFTYLRPRSRRRTATTAVCAVEPKA
jgi:radical SAM superfamily enzyme YgiQ (UPF0313 family)